MSIQPPFRSPHPGYSQAVAFQNDHERAAFGALLDQLTLEDIDRMPLSHDEPLEWRKGRVLLAMLQRPSTRPATGSEVISSAIDAIAKRNIREFMRIATTAGWGEVPPGWVMDDTDGLYMFWEIISAMTDLITSIAASEELNY